ncbi:hypothetical protein HDU97_003414 [Phlyctochytrium planicorne]|nr:hypothetical protein HDU97_003414 [Phlyctochytrium planicorne]
MAEAQLSSLLIAVIVIGVLAISASLLLLMLVCWRCIDQRKRARNRAEGQGATEVQNLEEGPKSFDLAYSNDVEIVTEGHHLEEPMPGFIVSKKPSSSLLTVETESFLSQPKSHSPTSPTSPVDESVESPDISRTEVPNEPPPATLLLSPALEAIKRQTRNSIKASPKRPNSFSAQDSDRSYDLNLCLPLESRCRDRTKPFFNRAGFLSDRLSTGKLSFNSRTKTPTRNNQGPSSIKPSQPILDSTTTSSSDRPKLAPKSNQSDIETKSVDAATFVDTDFDHPRWETLPIPGRSANRKWSNTTQGVRNEAVTFLMKSRSMRVRKMKSQGTLNAEKDGDSDANNEFADDIPPVPTVPAAIIPIPPMPSIPPSPPPPRKRELEAKPDFLRRSRGYLTDDDAKSSSSAEVERRAFRVMEEAIRLLQNRRKP